ncbi:aminotransferase class I/II-fold pyridoxal phosphate-dependent enzyme [Catellatospora sp. KI3]|uniref:aminotransferase class I/II-fold pyridoxal phosphate-dependent enzyme n=1 Tax=Catellatospora sp. KI3 TaxID=3041620 RepID=UPI0024832306|nr:aminotransferase class I/II-fold pyridoxal phosphate-dependent enzyme [Catellatospora sp. KI3]MDI1466074.1 aminotransferase class I/II-fold pyridoxal phosphate-dependent enzyme [Catellatospora sp. KI3]
MIPGESKLERFFARYEFSVRHILGASDVDGYPLGELLALADDDAARRWHDLTLGYTETTGHPALRAAIADRYDKVSPDEVVVCGGGAVEALFLLVHALIEQHSHLVVVWPAFESLHRVAQAAGAAVTLVPLRAHDGWELDLDAVRAALRPDTGAIVVNYPHNPTGALPAPARFQELLDLARERGIRVVSDEVYRGTEFDPATRLPAAADVDASFVSLGVMSKAYGLAGLRIGWLACRDRALLARVTAMKDFTSVCASAPAEILALIALRAHDQVTGRCMDIVRGNLAHVDAFFARHADLFEWIPPRAGTVAFPLLRAPVPIDEFVHELIEQEGVMLLPASVFDHTENRFRIGLGRSDLPAALARLESYLSRRWRSRA